MPATKSIKSSASERQSGGAEGIRTPDLLIANETLYQLSYDPAPRAYKFAGDGKFAMEIMYSRMDSPPAALRGLR